MFMARGGYISTEAAVRKLNAVLDSRDRAHQILIDALVSEQLAARGKPVLPKPSSRPEDGPLKLRDVSTEVEPSNYGAENSIPGAFWANTCPSSMRNWNLKDGFVFVAEADPCAYSAVKLEERAVNALVRKFDPKRCTEPKKPRRRKRTANWEEWISALATCIMDRTVHQGLSQNQVLKRVNDRLEDWGLDPCEDSTMAPAVSAVLMRLKELAATKTQHLKT